MSQKTKEQQLQELQEAQIAGQAETVKANKGNAKIPAGETNLVHIELVQKVNNPSTQTYDEYKKTMALEPRDFERMESEGAFDAYSTTILHDPRTKAEIKEAEEAEPLISPEPEAAETPAPATTTTTARKGK